MKIEFEPYRRIYFYAVGLLLAWLPFFHVAKTYPLIMFVLIWLGLFAFNQIDFLKYKLSVTLFICVPLFVFFVGWLVTTLNHESYRFIDIEKYLGAALPIMILAGPKFKEQDLDSVFKIFTYGLIAASAICLMNASYRAFQTGQFYELYSIYNYKRWYFLHTDLTQVIKLHPAYFALLNCVAVFYFTLFRGKLPTAEKISIVYLSVFTFLLSSRAVLLAAILIMVGAIVFSGRRRRMLAIVLGSTTLCVMAFMVEGVRKRLVEIQSASYNYSARHHSEWNTLTVRLAIWSTAVETIRESPIYGYGLLGHRHLLDAFRSKDFLYAYEARYNTHNQYLSWLLHFGIFGLLFFMYWMLFPVLKASSNKFSICFILLLFAVFFFEDYFHRSVGILGITLLHSIISLYNAR